MASLSESGVVRSISLPSRFDSDSLHFEAELNKVKSWDCSSSSVQLGLVRLAELYGCVAEAIRSPQTQVALRKSQVIEEALDGSVGLLDTCGLARDLISMMREQVQDLQSVLRRRPGQDSSVESTVHAYTSFRKKTKKDISKCLRSLKRMESSIGSSLVHDHDLVIVLKWLREVNATAVSVFRSLMVLLSEPAAVGGWSLVRKLMPKAGGSSEQSGSEIGELDFALQCMVRGKKINGGRVEVGMVRGRLERVDETMKELEGGLGCIFRCLIENRVALLNVLAL